jgi:peptidoglycan/xylan/chitin deacetylase (PgdA/CDA1 family)
MLKTLLRIASPGGPRGVLSVLIFHRVLARPDPLRPNEPTAAAFDARLRWLNHHCNVLPLDQALRALGDGALPQRAASITFDDGYADNHDLAAPALRRWSLPATIFVATGFLDGGRMFNDTIIESVRQAPGGRLDLDDLDLGVHAIDGIDARRAAIARILPKLKALPPTERDALTEAVRTRCRAEPPRGLMMTSAQVRALHRQGFGIGAHTVTHPILAATPLDVVRREIVEGRAALEGLVGAPVSLFAYPNGRPGHDFRAEHVRLVRELGFDAAVTTGWGAARPDADRFQIPRFTPWDRDDVRFGLRLARNLVDDAHALAG